MSRPGKHQLRFIPTCVGNTLQLRTRNDKPPGSSPHAWGTRLFCLPKSINMRFIPTCVGNTLHWCSARKTITVHPHMRGEHTVGYSTKSVFDGSSPHAWGTLQPRL